MSEAIVKLSPDSKKYFLQRTREVECEKIKSLWENASSKKTPVSDSKKKQLIIDADVPLRRSFKLSDPIGEVFDFSEYEESVVENEKGVKKQEVGIHKAATKLRDRIHSAEQFDIAAALTVFENQFF
jgi:hypothetical protein